eukprot:scaffold13_cov377-Prasinococcus_capsulatus_cf.AAC.8
MAGRVQEGDEVWRKIPTILSCRLSVYQGRADRHLEGSDMLGDAAGLLGGHRRVAQVVQEGRFAMVHVPHDAHHCGPGSHAFDLTSLLAQLGSLNEGIDEPKVNLAHLVAEGLSHHLCGLRAEAEVVNGGVLRLQFLIVQLAEIAEQLRDALPFHSQ